MFGMPYMSSPPMRSARSYTVTRWPARLSCAAQAKPDGPEPTTATFLPVRFSGGSAVTHPCDKAIVDNRRFDVFDRHRQFVEPEHAGAFARRRTDAAGEFGKVIGLVQPMKRFLPQAAINQIVPFRDQIVDRTARGHAADQLAGVTKRNAAIHAARALLLQFRFRKVLVKLVPVFYPLQRRTIVAAARARSP